MDGYRLRPRSNFIFNAQWEELYVLAEHWKSDLDFYCDEIRFLNNLINKYFERLENGKNIIVVKTLKMELLGLKSANENIRRLCLKHLRCIEDFIENSFTKDVDKFKSEHEKLEENIAKFIREFKKLKKDIFLVTEKVMEDERLVL